MPKPKKLSRKELLKEPEVVRTLQEKAQDWLMANQKTAAVAAGALVLVVAVAIGVRQWSAYKEAQAMELYGQAQIEVSADAATRPESVAKALEQLAKVAADYPDTKAARFALIERANILYGQGKAKEAASLYEECLRRFQAGDELDVLARQGLAYCKLAAGDLAGAQKLFQELAGQGLGAGSAQLQLGLIYELQGRVPEAVEAYKKAAKQAQGPEAALASSRLEAILPSGAGGA